MGQPYYLSNGNTTPNRSDTRLRLLTKWLGVYQNRASANPANNPNPNNTRRQILVKLNKAIKGL